MHLHCSQTVQPPAFLIAHNRPCPHTQLRVWYHLCLLFAPQFFFPLPTFHPLHLSYFARQGTRSLRLVVGGYTQRIANMQHTAAHCTMGRYALPSVVLACLALSCGMLVTGGNAQAMECKELGCGGYVAGQACQCDEVILGCKQDSTAICILAII